MKITILLLSLVLSLVFVASTFSQEVDTVNKNRCSLCKEFVKLAIEAVKTGQIQELIEQYLSEFCPGPLKHQCEKLVRKALEELVKHLHEDDPEKLCHRVHLC
ncbi:hypothetical protein CRM22_001065 [Opisthorchis felineus]|uniref:Saposin B-type domain-containing protein n=1 Tax=Opisthorchis felineus TaxID=147828 RepID=A0A4S2MCG4_OPIFE|nr:hypothetical protein CRM22_001065 [Opisthorchis felineus]